MSRTYRKNKYTGSKRFDKTCRCHGGCPYCEDNRMYQKKKELERTEEQLKEYERNNRGT